MLPPGFWFFFPWIFVALWLATRAMLTTMPETFRPASRLASRWTLRGMWAVANLVGVYDFIVLAMPNWIEPELKDFPGASGGAAVVWGLTAFPIFLSFFFANVVWATYATRQALKGRGRWPAVFSALTLALWIAAFIYDGAHHGS